MEAKRYYSLDLLKWIMSIVVIAQHTHPFETVDNSLFLSCQSMAFPFPCLRFSYAPDTFYFGKGGRTGMSLLSG